MREGAVGAILLSVFQVSTVSAALFAQSIEWAVAEKAVKLLFGYALVTGEIFALPVLKKTVMLARFHHLSLFCGI